MVMSAFRQEATVRGAGRLFATQNCLMYRPAMRRALAIRILIGLVVAALVLLPMGLAMMPAPAMAAPDSMAQTTVQDQDSSCPDCCRGCMPTPMQSDACMAQCAVPVAIAQSPVAIATAPTASLVAHVEAPGSGFVSAPTAPPPKSAL